MIDLVVYPGDRAPIDDGVRWPIKVVETFVLVERGTPLAQVRSFDVGLCAWEGPRRVDALDAVGLGGLFVHPAERERRRATALLGRVVGRFALLDRPMALWSPPELSRLYERVGFGPAGRLVAGERLMLRPSRGRALDLTLSWDCDPAHF